MGEVSSLVGVLKDTEGRPNLGAINKAAQARLQEINDEIAKEEGLPKKGTTPTINTTLPKV